jgi:hypothetical protein
VLTYSVWHMGVSTRFVVQRDGTAEYVREGGGAPPIDARGVVDPAALDALARALEANGFCSLVSRRRAGIPDESRPRVSVRLAGLDCEVVMWDNEFREDPKAEASLAAIESLGATIRGGTK